MPLRNNRTYPYKIELRTYLKYCNGAETFYSYDPQRRRLQNLAVNAGGKTILDSALQLQSIKDNYKTFDLPYNGVDNTDYVNGKGFSSDDDTPEAAQARAMVKTRAGEAGTNERMQFYYHPDHLGSSSYITNLDGEVAQHIEYVPFGEVFIEERNNTWNTPYLFNAKEFDEETGLYYYGARYYDPRLGLWMSTDPKAEKFPKMSPYAFSNNNPIFYVDIDGFEPTPYPKALLGSVDYYKWRYNDFIKQNPGKKAPSYYLNYGNKYIQRFTNETNKLLSKQGKQLLVNARKNLQVAIEDKLKADPTIELRNGGNDFKEFAFESHIDAYWNAGLYRLNTVDLVAIVLTPNFKDLMSKDGIEQATKMIDKLINYWLDNPKEGFKRGVELLANKDKIKAMAVAKAIREGVDPDKAMPILDKIIKNIPTIEIDL